MLIVWVEGSSDGALRGGGEEGNDEFEVVGEGDRDGGVGGDADIGEGALEGGGEMVEIRVGEGEV